MKRSMSIVCLFVLLVAGCQTTTPVEQLVDSEILTAQALVLMVANQPGSVVDPEPDISECQCAGTKRSGDGLGPCICGANCKCKATKSEAPPAEGLGPSIDDEAPSPEGSAPKTQCRCNGGEGPCTCGKDCKCQSCRCMTGEPCTCGKLCKCKAQAATAGGEVFSQYVTVDQLNALGQTVKQVKEEQGRLEGLLGEQQTQLAVLLDKFKTGSEKMNATLTGFSERLKAISTQIEETLMAVETRSKLDSPSPPSDEEEVPLPRPEKQVVVFKLPKGQCKYCEVFEVTDVPILKTAGWSVGDQETNQIVIVLRDSEMAARWPEASKKASDSGVPSYAFHLNGELKSFVVGYMTGKQVAERLNEMKVASH